MTNSKQEILESYRITREKNAREEKRRQEEILSQDTRLKRLVLERHQMILNATRNVFSGEEPLSLEDKMIAYNKEIKKELQKNGYSSDYLAPIFECTLCEDTGYVGEIVKTPCVCLKQKMNKGKNLTSEGQTFETYDPNIYPNKKIQNSDVTQRSLMEVVSSICKAYACAFPNQYPQDLLLHGQSGLGKTFLLSCIYNKVREKGHDALMVNAFSALNLMRNAFFTRSNEADALYNTELLLIDDLGMEPLMENVTVEQIYHLFSERRNNNLPTVFSTNLNPLEIKNRYTERVFSRLMDTDFCRVLHLQGEDIRLVRR